MWYPQPDPARRAQYRATGAWSDDSIQGVIGRSIARFGDKPAVRDARGRELSYRELGGVSAVLAGHLIRQGLRSGEIVSLCLPNWVEAVLASLAVLRAGGVMNPIPPTYGRKELDYAIRKCRSAAIIVAGRFRSADYTEHLADILPGLDWKPHVYRIFFTIDEEAKVVHVVHVRRGARRPATAAELKGRG